MKFLLIQYLLSGNTLGIKCKNKPLIISLATKPSQNLKFIWIASSCMDLNSSVLLWGLLEHTAAIIEWRPSNLFDLTLTVSNVYPKALETGEWPFSFVSLWQLSKNKATSRFFLSPKHVSFCKHWLVGSNLGEPMGSLLEFPPCGHVCPPFAILLSYREWKVW